MNRHKSAPRAENRTARPSNQALPSTEYVKQELRRLPKRSRVLLNQFGSISDLEQEIHLAYYQTMAQHPRATPAALRRVIHNAAERFRYREVVRRLRYETPEESAGNKYHQLMYGTDSDENLNH